MKHEMPIMRLRTRITIFIAALCVASSAVALAQPQPKTKKLSKYNQYRAGYLSGYEVDTQGDTTQICQVTDVIIYGNIGEIRKQQRLIRNVKAVYPYVMDARRYFENLNARLAECTSDRERDRITKEVQNEILEIYTPILRKMTYSQGKILIRLIDRETERTSYQLVEDFRGRFAAKFWNTIARMFRANLKAEYDPAQGEDKLIEQIINLYEAGLI